MRQVPEYVVIGNGRMARHFCHYLTLMNLPFRQWHRQHPQPFAEFIQHAQRLYLLISDHAIDEFAQHPDCRDLELVHFSGALHLEGTFSAHPMMTFSQQLYTLAEYQQIPFTVAAEGPSLATLLPGLNNDEIRIPQSKLAYYHSLLVMGGNFSQLLWHKMARDLTTLGVPIRAVNHYVQKNCDNFKYDPNASLTGPLVRNDIHTINQNLQALQDDAFLSVYHAFLTTVAEDNDENHT